MHNCYGYGYWDMKLEHKVVIEKLILLVKLEDMVVVKMKYIFVWKVENVVVLWLHVQNKHLLYLENEKRIDIMCCFSTYHWFKKIGEGRRCGLFICDVLECEKEGEYI